jgi:pheromone shutdown protein TraB
MTGLMAGVQAALDEGVKCGATQIVLADRPAFVSQRRLAQGVWGSLFPRFIVGLLTFNGAVFMGSFGLVDQGLASNAAVLSILGTLASFVPVALPFYEIWQFSKLSGEEIEQAVRVPEPIQENIDARMKLYGEDALLDWPGASESIIEERDEYMTRALAASASGAPCIVPDFCLG